MYEAQIFQNILIADLHCDMLSAARAQGRSIAVENTSGHADIPRMLRGGVSLVLCALFTYPDNPKNMLREILNQIADFNSIMDGGNVELVKIHSLRCLDKVKSGTISGMLTLEGADSLGGKLDNLMRLYRLGVRGITLTWNGRNEVADGCMVKDKVGGLTDFGKDVLETMQELGMLVDLSHISERGFWDVLDVVKGPVIASHSNAKGLCLHVRNLTDEQLHAIAMTDGVVGITFAPGFVSRDAPTVEHVVNHIDYVCEEIGVRHVAIGSDFDGIDSTPYRLCDATKYSSIIEELVRRGYNTESIRAIMGENALRVLSCVLK